MRHFFILKNFLTGLCVAIACSHSLYGKSQKTKQLPLNQPIPWHPKLKRGEFRNGFRYFLLPNPSPENRISLRLLVNAGAFMETETEDGIAHFIEHMCFNGTTHYAPGTLIQYFQRIGMGFGHDMNAFTSYNGTGFKLELPNNDKQTLSQALDVLYDQAFECQFLPSEIDRERGIILAEKMARDSVNYRAQKDEIKFIFPQHLISKRFAIGTESTIHSFKQKDFFNFYKRWYTPNRMALVVVGDFKEREVLKLIQKRFQRIKKVEATPLPDFGTIPLPNGEMKFHVYKDKELSSAYLSLAASRSVPIPGPYNLLRQVQAQLVWALITRILDFRMEELMMHSSLQMGKFNFFQELPGIENVSINFYCLPKDIEETCKILEHFFRKVNMFGFSQKEVNWAKKSLRKVFQLAADMDKEDSSAQADEIVSALMSHLTYNSGKQAVAFFDQLADSLNAELCNQMWKEMWANDAYLLAQGNLSEAFNEEKMKSIWNQSQKEILAPPTQKDEETFQSPPFGEKLGKIVEDKVHSKIGVECLRFKNNVRVNLKQSTFEKNRILVYVSLGSGMLSLPNKKWEGLPHLLSSSLVNGGLKQYDATTIDRLFADKNVNVDFDVQEDDFAFKAKTSREHFEEQIRLIGSFILEPGYRTEALDLFKKTISSWYKHLSTTPQGVLQQQVARFLTNEDNRFGYPALEIMEQRNFDEAKTWLTPVFDKDYIEIAIVGDFDREEVIRILQSTFGALPERAASKERFNSERQLSWPDRPQTKQFTFESSIDKSIVQVVFPTESAWNLEHVRTLNVLSDILKNRLLFKIRQEMGDTYSPSVSNKNSETFKDRGSIVATLIVNEDKTDELVHKITHIANEIAEKGVTDDEVTRAVNPLLTQIKEELKTNAYWIHLISNAQEYPEKLTWPIGIEEAYASIKKEDIQKMAQRYLKSNNAIEVIVRPQINKISETVQKRETTLNKAP